MGSNSFRGVSEDKDCRGLCRGRWHVFLGDPAGLEMGVPGGGINRVKQREVGDRLSCALPR